MEVKTGLIIDLFAGGGGASEGIRMALGRSPNVAINHDPKALAMHEANHPETWHIPESVWDADPDQVCGREPVDLLWASPDCKHFSRAKGGKPVEKNIRSLATVVIKWAMMVKPQFIMLENVPEFRDWGPLIERDGKLIPDPTKKGWTFRWWLACLRDAGYIVDHKIMKACDFGAPTTRKRLFVVARRDGHPVVWPEPTHGPGHEHPWRTAAECIDWSLPCPSIFTRKRPLAEKTLARIARGIVKYVIEAKEPFIVQTSHTGTTGRGNYIWRAQDQLRTLSSCNEFALVVPYLKRDFGRSVGGAADQPAPTATQSNHTSLVTALLTKYHNAKHDEDRCQNPGEPITTLDTQNRFGLVSAHITKFRNGAIGSGADEPMPTITAGSYIKRPAGAGHALGLCAAHLTKFYGTNTGADLNEPAPTITSGGNRGGGHAGLVAAFLMKYYSNGSQGQRADDPMHTLVAKARMGLVAVQIGGEDYVITDVGMRMLEPEELKLAQGFRRDYKLSGSKANQVAKIGNSVPPQFAEALVRANMVPVPCEVAA